MGLTLSLLKTQIYLKMLNLNLTKEVTMKFFIFKIITNKRKIIYYILFILFLMLNFIFSFSSLTFAAYPKLVTNIINAFEKLKGYIVAIATPAAGVSIGCGFLMQKFSFGDEEKIRTGKKIIRTSFLSYAFIISLDLIVSLIENLIT
jgi:hypothetical protein